MDVETQAFVVVGVDFGTTYTGVAYTLSDNPDPGRVTVIDKWPGVGNQNRPKVPTEISYLDSGEQRWGWQLRAGAARFGGFKLLLDPAASSQSYNDEQLALTLDPGNPAMQTSLRAGRSATDMATEYLRLVHKEVMIKLAKRFPRTLDGLKMKFVVTTPAMWTPAAQHNTLMAAKAAGFGSRPQDTIENVTEPEAAACYSLKEINRLSTSLQNQGISGDAAGWQVGNQIIVCDAGGGTVDLVAYSVDQTSPYLRVSETTPPRGGLCGATSLDQRFLQLVRRRLGAQAHVLDGSHAGRGSRLLLSFDDAKHNFGTNDYESDEIIEHGIPNITPNIDNGIDGEYLTLTHDDMESIFDPVIDKVIALVESMTTDARRKQPSKPVVGLVLVGGFGESMYLFKKLKSWADVQSPPLIVCNPKDSWAAIAKGAVCFGLESIVHRRILPCHYGVVLDVPYDSSIHDSAHNYVDEFYGVAYNSDPMTWFAKKGQATDRENRIKVPFSYSSQDRNAKFTVRLRTCLYDEPPLSRRDARILNAPSVTVSLGSLPLHALVQKEVGGFLGFGTRTFYHANNFTREMILGSGSFKFEIRHDGTLLAVQQVDPQFVGSTQVE